MSRPHGEIGKRRREQVIDAAVAIIAEQGLPNLSLSAIEERASMSRGQLTYYFPTKEDILLAVFDRMLDMMRRREQAAEPPPGCPPDLEGWARIRAFLRFMILYPPEVPEFHALQYTFLSQIGHRDDFRQRLASLYDHWRTGMAADLGPEIAGGEISRPAVSPRTLASFIQALLHGLAMQRVADPAGYDQQEMLVLVMHLLDGYLAISNNPHEVKS